MKTLKNTIFFLGVLVLGSCCKDKPIPITNEPIKDNCPEMYDARSTPYINPYMGTLFTQSPIPPGHIYPDKYCYWYPCMNPTNEFEFCYARRENGVQANDDMDLYKYNFCSGKSTLITKHIAYCTDWSVKDWIIFTGQNRDLWKVKSNGDSLMRLTFTGNSQTDVVWNATGNLFIWNNTKIADENGNTKHTITNLGTILGWADENNIFSMSQGANNVKKVNIRTNQVTDFIPTNGNVYYKYLTNSNEFLGVEDSMYIYTKNIIYNVTNNKTTYMSSSYLPQSFPSNVYCKFGDKILLQQILRDTLTGDPALLNFRSHIAIMNADGTNERQILLPE